MESGYAYPERSGNNLAEAGAKAEAKTDVRTKNNIMVFSEVSRGHIRWEKKPEKKPEAFTNTEGPND